MEANEAELRVAGVQMTALELTACDMFDQLVKSGISEADMAMVDLAQSAARKIAEATETALKSGELTIEQLFDDDYQEIEGSNPSRFRTRLTDWADRVWRPLLDEISASNPRVELAILSNTDGFLPTHMSERSIAPNGDIAHDTKFCRNGRIVWTPIDQRAKQSTDEYLMAIHRQEGDGQTYQIVRDIFVPIAFGGKRWGDFVLCYL